MWYSWHNNRISKNTGVSAVLLAVIIKVIESCTAPEWRTNVIVSVPKKGDLIKYDNYLLLMSVVGKVKNIIC